MSKIENSIGWCDDTGNKVIGCEKVSPGCKNCYAEVGTIARVKRGLGIETWGPKGQRVPVADFAAKLRRLNKLCICDRCHETQPIERLLAWERKRPTPHPDPLPGRGGDGIGTEPVALTQGHEVAWIARNVRIEPQADRHLTLTLSPGEAETELEATIAGPECGLCPKGSILADDECQGRLRRIRFFADSNSDWLDVRWPVATLAEFLQDIFLAPNVDVILLTKRPELWRARLDLVYGLLPDWQHERGFARWIYNWRMEGKPPANVWLGVSVENQEFANRRIPELLRIPAVVHFISAEPLLGPIDLIGIESTAFPRLSGRTAMWDLDWVIVGGESGKNRRDGGVEAITGLAEQCLAAKVPVYVKQDLGFKSGQQGRIPAEVWKVKQFPQPA